jgi:[ribosomal protein S5]-alanine N-acetyltransferase
MLEVNLSPFTPLETERFFLRQFKLSDKEDLFEIRSNPEVMKYIPRPLAITVEDAVQHLERLEKVWNENEGINWAIEEKSSKKVVGIIGFFKFVKENYRVEVGYMLNPKWHKKGIMHEVLQVVIPFGFEKLKVHSIEAIVDPDNIASSKLLQKNHFRKEGSFKQNCFFEGKFYDSEIHSLVKGIDYKS